MSRRPLSSIPLPSQTIPYGNGYGPGDSFVALNPALEFVDDYTFSKIYADLSQSPQSIQIHPRYQKELFQPATYPPSLFVDIVSHALLPKPIVVHRSTINPGWVTVADVLGTLCELMKSVHVEEMVSNVHPSQNSFGGAGLGAPGSGGVFNNGQGSRRVRKRKMLDYLQGKHRFMGLSHSEDGSQTFVLHVA
jgi:hypothetical protein